MNTNIKIINKVLNYIILITTSLLLLAGLIWLYFIIAGWIQIGHLPQYGDTEIISFDGIDRQLIAIATLLMFYGIPIWAITLLAGSFSTSIRMNRPLVMYSFLVVVFDVCILLSPCFPWALD